MNARNRTTLFDRIARLAARSVGAPVAVINLRHGQRLSIIGSCGIYLDGPDQYWPAGAKLTKKNSMAFVANVSREPALKGHPLLRQAPFTRSMAHIPVGGYHSDTEASITIINPRSKWPFNATTSSTLTDLAMLVGDALKIGPGADFHGQERIHERHAGLEEQGPTLTDRSGQTAIENFLLKTLKKRTSIRSRKDTSYLTLRTWAAPVKQYQIEALRQIKGAQHEAFAALIASEMAEHIKKLFGIAKINCIVPVPCGNSQVSDCLSVNIARALALQIDLPCIEAIKKLDAPGGASHPKKSTRLTAPKLQIKEPLGSVLLVDDVATSGRHIELATRSLREISSHVSSIVWIGSD